MLLIGLPIAFNVFFFLLGRSFDYPGILRSPPGTVLSRFLAGGVQLKLLWYGFMLTAVLFAPLAVLMGQVLARDGLEIVPVATTIGVLAAIVQFLGLARWPFAVPGSRAYEDPSSSPATREAAAVVFDAFNRYLGVAVGECLGYLLTGAGRSVGIAMLRSSSFDDWLGWPGSSSVRCSRSARSSSSAASRRTAGRRPGRSSRSPTRSGRSGSSRPGSSCSPERRRARHQGSPSSQLSADSPRWSASAASLRRVCTSARGIGRSSAPLRKTASEVCGSSRPYSAEAPPA